MKSMDTLTKVILGLIGLFVIFLATQYDPDNVSVDDLSIIPDRHDVMASEEDDAENVDIEQPVPITYPVISGFSGEISINGMSEKAMSHRSITDSSISAGNLQTSDDAWLRYNLSPTEFIHLSENTSAAVNDYTYTLNEGVLWVRSSNVRVQTDQVRVQPGDSNTPNGNIAEYVVLTEPQKVRVFVLDGSVSLSAFGQNKRAKAGTGFSLFLDRAYISDYAMGSEVKIQKPSAGATLNIANASNGIDVTWTKGDRAERYWVEVTRMNEVEAYTDIRTSTTTSAQALIEEAGEVDLRVGYANNYDTWGELSDRRSISVSKQESSVSK